MKLFAFLLLAAFGLSAAVRLSQPKSLNINTSLRQQTQFTSFINLNQRGPIPGRARPPIQTECLSFKYSQLSGFCNNRRNIKWGAIDTPFATISTPFVHNISMLPSAREVSNVVCAEANQVPNRRGMSEMVTFFGQFLDHTITETSVIQGNAWNIPVPAGDTFSVSIPFLRTKTASAFGRKAPQNILSSYIDAASVYSSHLMQANKLRTMTGGLMKTGADNNLPPLKGKLFDAGDRRANENPNLTAFHTVFVREHNRVVAEVKKVFPTADDEELYQRARKVVIAELQAIVYYEYLPAMTGRKLRTYKYNENVEAAVSNEFSTVGFRVGHTLINSKVTSILPNGKKMMRMLRDSFFNPGAFIDDGMDSFFRGMMNTKAAEVDAGITSEVRSFLVASETQEKTRQLDLAALNIQRGRDHNIPSYNNLRTFYGLPKLRTIQQITKNVGLQIKLEKAYGDDINKIDAWVGGISEDHVTGSLGPLFARIWLREFTRLRDGDRFHFENDVFDAKEKTIPTVNKLVVSKTLIGKVLQHVLKANSKIASVPANPFFV